MKLDYFCFDTNTDGVPELQVRVAHTTPANAISLIEGIEALINEMNGDGTLAAERKSKPKPGRTEPAVATKETALTTMVDAVAGAVASLNDKTDDTPFEGSTPIPEPTPEEKPKRTRKPSTRHPVEHTVVTKAPPLGDAFYAEIVDVGIADGVPYTRVLEAIQTKLTESFLVGSGPSEADLITYVKTRYEAAVSNEPEGVEEDVEEEGDEPLDELDDLFESTGKVESTPEPAKAQVQAPQTKATTTPEPAKTPEPAQTKAATPPTSEAPAASGSEAALLATLRSLPTCNMLAVAGACKKAGLTPEAAIDFILRHLSESWVPKLAKAQFPNASVDVRTEVWASFWSQS